jgi:hypothetical protein
MCALCDKFGRKAIPEDDRLRRAMKAIASDMIKDGKFTEHLRQLVDIWIGLEPELGTEDWERSHR